jgi:hypothetical protein
MCCLLLIAMYKGIIFSFAITLQPRIHVNTRRESAGNATQKQVSRERTCLQMCAMKSVPTSNGSWCSIDGSLCPHRPQFCFQCISSFCLLLHFRLRLLPRSLGLSGSCGLYPPRSLCRISPLCFWPPDIGSMLVDDTGERLMI